MQGICLYLHMHQPIRYREYSVFDIANNHNYFNSEYKSRESNEQFFKKVATKSYHPMLNLIEKNIKKYPNFKVSLSITGTWLEQAKKLDPTLITQIKRLVKSGRVEILGETYYHSLAFFFNRAEFNYQVQKHKEAIEKTFNVTPMVFRNTELAYNDKIAKWANTKKYKGILAEGWDKILKGNSPNYVYKPVGCAKTRLLLKNYRLSDDIAFRFSDQSWREWPLTADKYLKWLQKSCKKGNLINLFMDFETFGEHQWKETGIFDFINSVISQWLSEPTRTFLTASEACDFMKPVSEISMPSTVTWADSERDLSAWLANSMQKSATKYLYSLRNKVLKTKDQNLIRDWRLLTTSDHPYSMCTKYWNDGNVHAYFSAYESPYESFIYFMNILRDIEFRIKK